MDKARTLIHDTRGGTIIILVIMMTFIFPLYFAGGFDLSNVASISEELKTSINLATKAAATRIDWALVPYGDFYLQTDRMLSGNQNVIDMFEHAIEAHLDIDFVEQAEGYWLYDDGVGNQIKYYVAVYNDYNAISFPSAGSIPIEVIDDTIQVEVDRPTVFAVITANYRFMPVFGSSNVTIVRAASHQLNYIARDHQNSANR